MNSWFKDGAGRWSALGQKYATGLSVIASFLLFAIALIVRLPARDGRPLWTDELWRALLVLDPDYWQTYFSGLGAGAAITSPVYALFIKSVSAFYVSTNTLRLSSFIPGVLAPVMAFAVIRKAGGSIALAFVAGLPFALNEVFVSYSNELKPYVFEVFIHLACLYVWLVMIAAPGPKIRTWVLCLLTLVLALLATPNAIFMLPAFGFSLFVLFLTRKDLKSTGILIGVFACLGALVAVQYLFFWHAGAGKDMISYWSPGFRTAGQNYAVFFGEQLYAMWLAAFSTLLSVRSEAGLVLIVFAASLLWIIYTGKASRPPVRNYLIFFATLAGTLGAVNFLQLWPLGALRPNLFLYGYMIIFLFLLLAQIPQSRPAALVVLAGAAVFLLWQAYSPHSKLYYPSIEARLRQVGPGLEQNDRVVEDFSYGGPVGKIIQADCPKKKTVVFADGFVGMAILYYAEYDTAHRQGAALLTGKCVKFIQYGFTAQDPEGTSALFAKNLAGASNAWFLYAHTSDSDVAALQQVAQRFGHISVSKPFVAAGYFNLITNPAVSGAR